jgi:hypothetical protein
MATLDKARFSDVLLNIYMVLYIGRGPRHAIYALRGVSVTTRTNAVWEVCTTRV